MIESVPDTHWYDFRNKSVCLPLSELSPSFGMWHVYILQSIGVDYEGSLVGRPKEMMKIRKESQSWLRLNEPSARIS